MNRSLLTLCVLTIACLPADFSFAQDVEFDGWTVSINPRADAEQPEAAAQADAEPARVVKREIRVRVRQACPQPSLAYGWMPYYYGLPRVGANFSVYFPWRNYRGYYGYSSQYRPRTIYNYGYGYRW